MSPTNSTSDDNSAKRALTHAACAAALISVSGVAFAADAAVTVVAQPKSFWSALVDNAVGLTILFLLLSAIIGAIVKNRKRDRVLKDFDRYTALVELEDGRRIWGRVRVFPNGIEIIYPKPVHDPSGHVEASFFLHQTEFAAVRAILRPTGKLSPANAKRRRRDLQHSIHPTVFRRLGRFLLIQFSILRDAFMQVFTLLVGQAKSVARPGTGVGSVLQTQDKQIATIGQTMIGAVNLAYDPLLESLYGQACVAELPETGGWREMPGFLKEYSADWMLILRSAWSAPVTITLQPGDESVKAADWKITVRRAGEKLVVENGEQKNVELERVECAGTVVELKGAEVLPGGSHEIDAVGLAAREVVLLHLRYLEPGDLILPRAKAILRHRGPEEDLTLLENLGIRRRER